MKALFTLSSLISIAITGIVSFRLFERAHYNASALLTITSFLTVTLLVTIIGSKKIIFQ
jgi:hypothetical protein